MAEIINLEQIKQVAEATNNTQVVNLGDFFAEGNNLYTNSKGNIIQWSEVTEGLTGGTKTGATAFNVIEGGQSGSPVYTLQPKAQVGGMTGSAAVSAVLNGLGIALASQALKAETWEYFAQKFFPESETVAEALDKFEKYVEPVYYINKNAYDPSQDPDWGTYVDEAFINKVIQFANEGGYSITNPEFEPLKHEAVVGQAIQLQPDNVNSYRDGCAFLRTMHVQDSYLEILGLGLSKPRVPSFLADPHVSDRVQSNINELITRFVNRFGHEPNCWLIYGNNSTNYTDPSVQPTYAETTYYFRPYYIKNNGLVRVTSIGTDGTLYINSNDYEDLGVDFRETIKQRFDSNTHQWYFDESTLSNISSASANTDFRVPNNVHTRNVSLSSNLEMTKEPVEGVVPIQNANEYDPSKNLEQNFPAWVNGRTTVATIVNGILGALGVLPIGVPSVDPRTDPNRYPSQNPYPEVNPQPDPSPQPQPKPDPDPQKRVQTGDAPVPLPDPDPTPYRPVPDDIVDPEKKPVPIPPTPTPPTPTPTPVPVPPLIGGSANKLFTVYKPSQSNLDSLGNYLWTPDILRELVEFFTNNPMDAIISLHQIYCTPTTGSSKNIKLGYLDTGISSPVVTNQYTYIDCGSISVPEFYGSVLDYAPYTEINIFLPFIGVKPLDVNLVMASVVSVKYAIDVFTGACLCTIDITKRGAKVTTYHFDGNCSIQLPLTGADRSRLLSGVLSMATVGFGLGGVGGAVMGGVAGGVTNMKANIQKSGTIGSNVGAMDIKVPYLVVTRNLSYEPSSYNRLYGIPSNKYLRLSQCRGYTRVKDVHTDNISGATQSEKASIENILKQGIIIQ